MTIEMRGGVLSWTGDDITDERMAEWKKLTLGEVVNKREEVEAQIASTLAHLYLQTGLLFDVENITAIKTDEWNRDASGAYRVRLSVKLRAKI